MGMFMCSAQVDALFAAMEAVHDVKRSWENKPADDVEQPPPPVDELAAASRSFDVVAQEDGGISPSKQLVLDYQWQDEGSRVRSSCWGMLLDIFGFLRMQMSECECFGVSS